MDTKAVSQSLSPTDSVRSEAEKLILGCLNELILSRWAASHRCEECLHAGDVMGTLEAGRDVQFLEALYDQTLDVLRTACVVREGSVQ